MTRRKQHSGPDGIFKFAAGGTVEPGEIRDNPLRRRCTTCHADIGERCTRGSHRHRGRVPIQGFHEARTQPVTEET